MGTPKKPVKKKTASKSPGIKKPATAADPKEKKRIIDDEDEEDDYDIPMDDLGRYESFEGYEEDDDY